METSISFCREMRASHHCGSSVFAVSGHVLSALLGISHSKHRESSYRGGQSGRWIKVNNRQHPAFGRVRDKFSPQ